MSILIDKNTSILIQGITGKQGRYHTERTLEYGVKVLAGVTPGKGGEEVAGVPVYNSVSEAFSRHPQIEASLILVPPSAVKVSALDAISTGIPLIVIVTEFVPVHDSLEIVTAAKEKGVQVLGPNTIGVITPGESKVGIMPGYIYSRGKIGVISRSGTLTHETASNMTFAGFGQSTCVGIGGDPIIGLTHKEALELFRDDQETELIVIIGEIGGVGEEMAAQYIKSTNYPKPVIAFIAGAQAPEGKKMGHAGAIVSGNMGTAKSKIESLKAAGVKVADTLGQLLELVEAENAAMGGILSTVPPIKDIGVDAGQ